MNEAYLYKYLDVTGASMMLYYRTLMFTNATKLNDPFDCHPGLIEFSNVPKERSGIWPAKNIEAIELNRYQRNREKIWLCSLSKVHDSLLMWSYYNSHKGVCVKLDMKKTKSYLSKMFGEILIGCLELEVQYKDVIEKPDYFKDSEDFIRYQMSTKAKAWQHEQEVRLITIDPSPRFMKLLPDQSEINGPIDWKDVHAFLELGGECFESVYLGVNIDAKQKEKITKVARMCNPDIKVYKMNVDPDAFKLEEELLKP